jgi:thioesterase domain-containing protein
MGRRLFQMLYRLFHRLGRQIPQRISTLENINRFAMSLFRPTVYPGKLIIFRSVSRGTTFDNDELLGWGRLVSGGIEVQDVAGRHIEMLNEPNVRVLALKLRTCLDRVQVQPLRDRPAKPLDVTTEPAAIL